MRCAKKVLSTVRVVVVRDERRETRDERRETRDEKRDDGRTPCGLKKHVAVVCEMVQMDAPVPNSEERVRTSWDAVES